MPSRSKIPADLKRQVLVEAGHRCAIPTCRSLDVDLHHIIPWAECQTHSYENLIALCPNCHRRAHKGEIDRKSLRMYKNNLRFLSDKFTVFELDLLFELSQMKEGEELKFPPFMRLMVKRILEVGYIRYVESQQSYKIGGMQFAPARLSITGRGAEFMAQVATEDIGY